MLEWSSNWTSLNWFDKAMLPSHIDKLYINIMIFNLNKIPYKLFDKLYDHR